jgi:hypothetical protein
VFRDVRDGSAVFAAEGQPVGEAKPDAVEASVDPAPPPVPEVTALG